MPCEVSPKTNFQPGVMSEDILLLLKKEVIQPQVPLRLPCYDFIPVTEHTFDAFLSQASWYNDFGCIQLP
jgi:hypothetical protein